VDIMCKAYYNTHKYTVIDKHQHMHIFTFKTVLV